MQQVDLTKTLEELEDERCDEPNFSSRLVFRANELRKKPLCELNKEDLRLLIGQQMSLDLLLPLALEKLVENPLRTGDLYMGDLFCSVLKVGQGYWEEHREFAYANHHSSNNSNWTPTRIEPFCSRTEVKMQFVLLKRCIMLPEMTWSLVGVIIAQDM
ncbi:hypothetical protein AK95_16345 [Paenibacillus sp. LC231]|uniref:contact-dependent growth inhibition system immunity protein n=1 Tax=Paenibacillus sp. LC231 TaxID=1120679 RepID=UPI0008DDC3CC|nr:contact-dependent growth inhibition system immunity protein [Paenibacillus sp. LC231]OIA98728.1 hypothetical protein AK95_16345 [Paenibacillus sp. LC231]